MLRALRAFSEALRTGERLVWSSGCHRLYTIGRDMIRHTDGERSVLVETEMLTGSVDRVVYAGVMRSLPPHENEVIDHARSSQIVAMVGDYLASRGERVEIDWEPSAESSGQPSAGGD